MNLHHWARYRRSMNWRINQGCPVLSTQGRRCGAGFYSNQAGDTPDSTCLINCRLGCDFCSVGMKTCTTLALCGEGWDGRSWNKSSVCCVLEPKLFTWRHYKVLLCLERELNLKEELVSVVHVSFLHSARQKFVRRAWEKAEISQKWAESSWAKKIEAREKVKKSIRLAESWARLDEDNQSIIKLSFCIVFTASQDDWLRPLQGHEGQENGRRTCLNSNTWILLRKVSCDQFIHHRLSNGKILLPTVHCMYMLLISSDHLHVCVSAEEQDHQTRGQETPESCSKKGLNSVQ